MKEQAFKGAVATLAVFGMAATPARAQQDMSDVEITATYIVDNIYMLQGRGGNIGLSVGGDGAFVIDDQFAPLTDKIQAAIAAVTDQPARLSGDPSIEPPLKEPGRRTGSSIRLTWWLSPTDRCSLRRRGGTPPVKMRTLLSEYLR